MSSTHSLWHVIGVEDSQLPASYRAVEGSYLRPREFARWIYRSPDEASRLFNIAMLKAFKESVEALGRIVDSSGVEFSVDVELMNWGNIFAGLWVSRTDEPPRLYKIFPPSCRDWPVRRHWIWADGQTPRAYSFEEELVAQPRVVALPPEGSDDPEVDAVSVAVAAPNIGVQMPDDPSTLLALHRGFGFDERGRLTFISLRHDELRRQRS